MGLKDDLAGVLARDARYDFDAYILVLQAFELVRRAHKLQLLKQREREAGEPLAGKPKAGGKRKDVVHIPGQKLCLGVKNLALRQYGDLALSMLREWGLHSTSDIGSIVYNLIASGDLEASPTDRRADFDDVFDFEQAMGPNRKIKRRSRKDGPGPTD